MTESVVDLNKRREEARAAMEGRERRAARVVRERELAAKRAAEEALKQELKKKRRALELEQETALSRERARVQALEEERTARAWAAKNAKATAEQIRREPTTSLVPLRTLKTDTAALIERQKISLAQIAAKEEKRDRLTPHLAQATDRTGRWLWLGFGLAAVLLAAGGASGYWWWQTKQATSKPAMPIVVPLIRVENNRAIDLTAASTTDYLQSIKEELARPATASGRLTYFYFTASSTILSWSKFLTRTGWPIDQNFSRLLGPDFMLLVFDGSARSTAWLFQVRSPETVLAELLNRGSDRAVELFSPFINPDRRELYRTRPFSDQIIKNQDVRVIKNDNGQMILLYTLLHEKLLVWAEDPAAFEKLLDLSRLSR